MTITTKRYITAFAFFGNAFMGFLTMNAMSLLNVVGCVAALSVWPTRDNEYGFWHKATTSTEELNGDFLKMPDGWAYFSGGVAGVGETKREAKRDFDEQRKNETRHKKRQRKERKRTHNATPENVANAFEKIERRHKRGQQRDKAQIYDDMERKIARAEKKTDDKLEYMRRKYG